MIGRVEQLGLKAHPIYGTERTVIAAIGEKRDEFRQSLEKRAGCGRGRSHTGPLQSGQPRSAGRVDRRPRRQFDGGQLPYRHDRRALLGGR